MTAKITIRAATLTECDPLTALCLRAKAHWGYDEAFMRACTPELTIHPDAIDNIWVATPLDASTIIGMVEISVDEACYLEKLFIEPTYIGTGVGRLLFQHACARARAQVAAEMGAAQMIIESDPQAAGFYESCGAQRQGEVASQSIQGRILPRYIFKII